MNEPEALMVGEDTPWVEQMRADLLKAAAILRTRGKCSRAYEDGHGSVCMVGAILAAVGAKPKDGLYGATIEQEARASRAERHVAGILKVGSVVPWSDSHSPDEAVRALERAAAALR